MRYVVVNNVVKTNVFDKAVIYHTARTFDFGQFNRDESRRQSVNIRYLTIFNTQKHIVENYRLSEELLDQVFGDIQCFLKNPKRRRRGLMSKLKLLCALISCERQLPENMW